MATFGENVKRLREAAGLKGIDLAERLSVSPPVVSAWENNRSGLPETPTLLKVAKALDCSVEDLLAGIDEEYDAITKRQAILAQQIAGRLLVQRDAFLQRLANEGLVTQAWVDEAIRTGYGLETHTVTTNTAVSFGSGFKMPTVAPPDDALAARRAELLQIWTEADEEAQDLTLRNLRRLVGTSSPGVQHGGPSTAGPQTPQEESTPTLEDRHRKDGRRGR